MQITPPFPQFDLNASFIQFFFQIFVLRWIWKREENYLRLGNFKMTTYPLLHNCVLSYYLESMFLSERNFFDSLKLLFAFIKIQFIVKFLKCITRFSSPVHSVVTEYLSAFHVTVPTWYSLSWNFFYQNLLQK